MSRLRLGHGAFSNLFRLQQSVILSKSSTAMPGRHCLVNQAFCAPAVLRLVELALAC